MYCSTCGSLLPRGRRDCDTCGATVARSASDVAALDAYAPLESAPPRVQLHRAGVCPRCDYYGSGIPYFSRGGNVVLLVTATVLTLPPALGAGGAIYYALRHKDRICPRCGLSWGKYGEVATSERKAERRYSMKSARRGDADSNRGGEVAMRVWSVILAVLGLLFVAIGVAEVDVVAAAVGGVSGVGAFGLHHAAGKARARRRDALLAKLQTHVLKLAGERQGMLTVTEVAAALSWPMRRAEKVLNSLDDGWRVNSRVTDEGVIVYEFRELLKG